MFVRACMYARTFLIIELCRSMPITALEHEMYAVVVDATERRDHGVEDETDGWSRL